MAGTARCAGRSNTTASSTSRTGLRSWSSRRIIKLRGEGRPGPGAGAAGPRAVERSEATNRLETAVAMLFIEHREEERRLEGVESELEDARGPRVQAAGPRDAEEKRDAAPPPAPPRAKKNSGRWNDDALNGAVWRFCRRSSANEARKPPARPPKPRTNAAAAHRAASLGRGEQAVLLRQPADGQGPVGRTGCAAAAPKTGLHGGELRAARRRARGGQGPPEPGRAGYPPAPGGDRRGPLRSHACHAGGRGARSNRRSADLDQNPESPDRSRTSRGLLGGMSGVTPGGYRPSGSPRRDARS